MIKALYHITAASYKQEIALELRNIFLYCELSQITRDVGGQIMKFYFRTTHFAFIKDKSLLSCFFSSPEPLGSEDELIVYPSSRRPSVRRRPSATATSFTMLEDFLLRNCWADQSQILCGASLGRGNDILFAASGSHDQDGRHAHIW